MNRLVMIVIVGLVVVTTSAQPLRAAPATKDPLRDAVKRGSRLLAAGRVHEARTLGQSLVATGRIPAAGHTILGLVARAENRHLRFPAGTTPPLGQSPIAWDPLGRTVAEKAFRAALSLRPGLDLAAGPLAELLAETGRSEDLEKLIDSLPSRAFTTIMDASLTSALPFLTDPDGAEAGARIASAWLKARPGVVSVRRPVVVAWMMGGKLDLALRDAPGWAAAEPDEPAWPVLLVETSVLAGRLEEADRAARGKPGSPRLQWLGAQLAAVRGDASAPELLARVPAQVLEARVLEHLRQLLAGSVGPRPVTRPGALTTTSGELVGVRCFVEAMIALQVRRRMAGWADAELLRVADVYKGIRDFERELAILRPLEEKVTRAHRTDTGLPEPDYWFRVGRATYHAGHLDAADGVLAKSRALGKDDPELWFHIARLRIRQGRTDEAMAALQKTAAWKSPDKHVKLAREQLAKMAAHRASPPPSPAAASPAPDRSAAPAPGSR